MADHILWQCPTFYMSNCIYFLMAAKALLVLASSLIRSPHIYIISRTDSHIRTLSGFTTLNSLWET